MGGTAAGLPRGGVCADCKGSRAGLDSGSITYPLITNIAAASTMHAPMTMSLFQMVEADVKGGAAVSKPTNRYEVNTGGRNAGRRCWCDAA